MIHYSFIYIYILLKCIETNILLFQKPCKGRCVKIPQYIRGPKKWGLANCWWGHLPPLTRMTFDLSPALPLPIKAHGNQRSRERGMNEH